VCWCNSSRPAEPFDENVEDSLVKPDISAIIQAAVNGVEQAIIVLVYIIFSNIVSSIEGQNDLTVSSSLAIILIALFDNE
jgi:hypothetical protein